MWPMSAGIPAVYPARRIYFLLALVGLLVSGLLAREALESQAGERLVSLFMFGVSLAFGALHLAWALTRVEITSQEMTVHRPGRRPLRLDLRQVVDVHQGGRFLATLSLVYHPVAPDGRVELDTPRILFLPAFQRQDELVELLGRRTE